MKQFVRRNIYLLLAVPLILVLMLCELVFMKEADRAREAKRIVEVFESKEKILKDQLGSIFLHVKQKPSIVTDWSLIDLFNNEDDDLEVAISGKNALLFWSSAQIAFPFEEINSLKAEGLVHLPTGWYYQYSQKDGEYTIRGFLLIKREFPYRNRYIRSSFQSDFDLPDNYLVQSFQQKDAINIHRSGGEYLFTIVPIHDESSLTNSSGIPELLFFAIVVLILGQISQWLRKRKRITGNLKLILSIGFSIFIYLIFNKLEFSTFFSPSQLFSPRDFAFNGWLASLGDFVLLSILMFYIGLSYFSWGCLGISSKMRKLNMTISFLFGALYFVFSTVLFRILLLNSSITLEFFSELKFSAANLYAFFCISLQIIGFILILLRLRFEFFKELGFKGFIFWCIVATIIVGWLASYFSLKIEWVPFIYFVLIILLIAWIEEKWVGENKYTFLLIMALISAAYVNGYARDLILEKKNKVMDLWAVKLSSERDAGAEIFLSELDNRLRKDTLIQYHLMPPYKSLESYFLNNYFTGFWRNYNLQITVCDREDSVYITDENKYYPSCFDFFDNLRKTKGMLVSGSNFYFMDRVNGRISYLGQLDLLNSEKKLVKVFLELNSRVIPEGKGYPELLLDEHASRESRDGGFSYAKYFDGALVDRGGEYQYGMNLPPEILAGNEEMQFSGNGYRHSSFKRAGNIYIIVSDPESTVYDWISTLPYLFLIFYLIGGAVLFFIVPNLRIWRRSLDFREKIQLTLILSLLGILTIIGIGLLFYNSNKLLNSLQDNLNEKLSAVSSELSLRVGQETELNAPARDFINDQLIVLSDILHTDINVYDLKGRLFATSRNEIFDRGLLSRRINPLAYKEIAVSKKTMFLHNENLGEMKFLSAYAPVYNQNSQLIGYLNLPYFTRQDDFTKQVSGFIVAFSNLYILLIMFSLIIAVFISSKLTAPLLQIENNLKGIQLGKRNAKIGYSGDDEIGRLVREYNKKVDELAESADLLARSERESAWQEMARQVAHEINNPLTPMKLSIQYLQRLKGTASDNFNDYFDRVSHSLIEQIDVLSVIASSFSDFASMPGIRNELINLPEKIKEVVLLFENTLNVSVVFNNSAESEVQVIADKDQFGRAIINLIKNGIQAIPKERAGILKIGLHNDQEWAYISVSDNGSGIPAELKDKLFVPSFTTKSSGMGLGLAITKRIIENFKGEIGFESNPDLGTTFLIKLPITNYPVRN